jgi:hypothetical protein
MAKEMTPQPTHPEQANSSESWIRLRSIVRWLAAVGFWGFVLAIFFVPAYLIVVSLAFLTGVWMLIKFARDNRKLFRQVGGRRFMTAAAKTAVVFLFLLPFLLPGIWLGNKINHWTASGIDHLQAWSAPNIVSEQVKRRMEKQVEERVRQQVPWWMVPAQWIGWVPDYATQARTEVQEIIETINKATPKPVFIRAVASAAKTLLLVIGIYSMFWMLLLLIRAYATLFGRVLVATKPHVTFDLNDAQRPLGRSLAPIACTDDLISHSRLDLALAKGERMLVKRNHTPDGAVPNLRVRWRQGALFNRLRRNLVFTNLIKGHPDRSFVFRAVGTGRYVSLRLEEGQSVIVDPKRIVGFAPSVHFRAHIDFSLALIALHHAVSMVVDGPGRLLLLTEGEASAEANASRVGCNDPSKMMLFGQDAVFEIAASDGWLNYLFSPCTVRPIKGSFFVWAPGRGTNSSMLGLFWNFIRQVYIPI